MTDPAHELSVLIGDDEPLARDGLRAALDEITAIRVVGEASSGEEAWSAIRDLEPDVALLDIEMPGLSGLEVARRVLESDEVDAEIVFVTAWDHYAVQAFEVRAVDYLVKPWDEERLRDILMRIQERRGRTSDGREALAEALREIQDDSHSRPITRLTVREDGTIRFIEVDTVETFEASGNHVVIRRGSKSHRIRATLRWLEEVLDPARFVRVHRSTILNVDGISEVRLLSSGDYEALLFNGKRVRVSRHYRDRLLRPGF